jgi:hypothetical protein
VRNVRFDWRWIVAIGVIAVLAAGDSIPWPIAALVAGASGGYLLVVGWQAWVRSGGPPSRGRVTYWRGQRIEAAPAARRGPALPRWSDIGPAAPYLIFGGVLVLVAVTIALRALGL